jgi:hypothetical protein
VRVGYLRGVYPQNDLNRILLAFEKAACDKVVINARPDQNRLLQNLVNELQPGDRLLVGPNEAAEINLPLAKSKGIVVERVLQDHDLQ